MVHPLRSYHYSAEIEKIAGKKYKDLEEFNALVRPYLSNQNRNSGHMDSSCQDSTDGRRPDIPNDAEKRGTYHLATNQLVFHRFLLDTAVRILPL